MAEPRSRSGAKGRLRGAHGTPSEASGGLGPEHSFSLQAIFELQRSVGRLEGKIEKLSEQADRQQRTVNWMARALFIATGALLILGPIVAWILNNGFDRILSLLAKGG